MRPSFPLTVVADADISERVRTHALESLVHVARFAPRPVLHARVTLREYRDPARERPAVAKATLDVSRRNVRAHVAAAPDGRTEHTEKAPVLLLEDAIERLNASGEPFVFFVDPQSRRGHVLYLRYDGHYGLLEPEM